MAPWGNGNYPTDICVYARCAEWMNQGLVMYRDMFDHKGPLVYLIYWGASFCGEYGIWMLDIAILWLSLYILYRMARLHLESGHALLLTFMMACFIQLPFTDEGGPEWIAMPGCIYSCYLLAKRIKDNDYCSLLDITLFSGSVAVCLATKPNTSACMIPVAIYIVWHLCRNFEWRIAGRYMIGVILGLGIICLPIALWLTQQGNWADFVDAYWRFNTASYGPMTMTKKVMGVFTVTLICLVPFYSYILYSIFTNKRTWSYAFITALFVFTLFLNAYIKNCYPHYIFPCVGVFALVLLLTWPYIAQRKALFGWTIGLYILVGIGSFGARAYLRLSPFDTSKDKLTAQYINAQTDENEYVMVCDVDDRSRWSSMNPSYSFVYRLWLLLNNKPASPYFYLPPSISPEMRLKSWEMIKNRAPEWVVCTDDHKAEFLNLGYIQDKDLQNDFYILKKP